MRLLAALTVGPARVVGLPAPCLAEGARADLVLIDPEARWTVGRDTLRSKSLNTPFLSSEVIGAIDLTMCAGEVIHARSTAHPKQAPGRMEKQTEKAREKAR
jgi:dihydroorotase